MEPLTDDDFIFFQEDGSIQIDSDRNGVIDIIVSPEFFTDDGWGPNDNQGGYTYAFSGEARLSLDGDDVPEAIFSILPIMTVLDENRDDQPDRWVIEGMYVSQVSDNIVFAYEVHGRQTAQDIDFDGNVDQWISGGDLYSVDADGDGRIETRVLTERIIDFDSGDDEVADTRTIVGQFVGYDLDLDGIIDLTVQYGSTLQERQPDGSFQNVAGGQAAYFSFTSTIWDDYMFIA
ncbi:MAG: hypothetical protein WCC57_16540 [Paracoccaceae bacterium]